MFSSTGITFASYRELMTGWCRRFTGSPTIFISSLLLAISKIANSKAAGISLEAIGSNQHCDRRNLQLQTWIGTWRLHFCSWTKVYDWIWQKGLIYNVSQFKYPLYIIQMEGSFLTGLQDCEIPGEEKWRHNASCFIRPSTGTMSYYRTFENI